MQIKSKNVLITGASRGIGLALAKEFARRDANLFLVSRGLNSNLVVELEELGEGSVELIELDLSQRANAKKLYEDLTTDGQHIDILVNNAGLLTGGLIENQDPEDVLRMFQVNLLALVYLTQLFLPGMLKRKNGKIINNASVSGKMFVPCASTYAASKAAVIAFTESVKQELRGTGVSTLLMITPGIQTKMFEEITDMYGGHLDLGEMKGLAPEKWARYTCDAVANDEDMVEPKGSTRWMLRTAKFAQPLFEKILASKFTR